MRQGDVLLIPLAGAKIAAEKKRLPPDKERGVVLAYGEVTGHAHTLDPDLCCLYNAEPSILEGQSIEEMLREMSAGGSLRVSVLAPTDRVLEVKREATLRHNEHNPICVKEGVYLVRRQREYDPEVERLVAD